MVITAVKFRKQFFSVFNSMRSYLVLTYSGPVVRGRLRARERGGREWGSRREGGRGMPSFSGSPEREGRIE